MELSAKVRENLRTLLAQKPAVFAIKDEPHLGGLLACLAIRFELNTSIDRLAERIGAEGHRLVSEILRENGEYGLAIAREDGQALLPKDPELYPFFDPSSVSTSGQLSRMVIFPLRVAQNFQKRGIELVIVRDWILSTCLSEKPEIAVDYNRANSWELVNNIGFMQAELMVLKRLPFFGTHDVVDHLAGASSAGLDRSGPLVKRVYRKMQTVFYCENGGVEDLLVSYFLGILLDDLAQPRWYGCERHGWLTEQILDLWEQLPPAGKMELQELPVVPSYWTEWIESLRAGRDTFYDEQIQYLENFRRDLGLGARDLAREPVLGAESRA